MFRKVVEVDFATKRHRDLILLKGSPCQTDTPVDIAAHKDLIAVVSIDGNLDLYRNCELQRSLESLHLPIRYDPAAGLQSYQYGRVFSLLDSGVLFFPYQAGGSCHLGHVDLESKQLPVQPLPGARLPSFAAYCLVPDCTVQASNETASK